MACLLLCSARMETATAAPTTRRQTRSGVDLEPETILPSQYFGGIDIDASLQPEKRLMLAVLEDAVGTFQKHVNAHDRRGRLLFAEAEEWFASADTAWPYSFAVMCQGLGLDADYLRKGLWKWREDQRSRRGTGGAVIRFPFRRVNGTRHAITGRPIGLRRSA